jgi:hypothetical protein
MRWCLAPLVVVGCHASSDTKSSGPAWTPVMFNQIHGITPDCSLSGQVWTCKGDSTTSTITLDANKHVSSLELTDLTRMTDEPPRRFSIALAGIVTPAVIAAINKHLATAWPTEQETLDGVTIVVTRTQKQPNTPTLHSVTIRW